MYLLVCRPMTTSRSAYFSLAEETALNADAARKGVWGQFLSNDALEREDEAAALLTRFIQGSENTVDDLLRAATGHFRMATLRGDISGSLAEHGELIHLTERARDPLVRSSFLVAYAWLLGLCGRYEEALTTLDALRELIRESFLDFVDAWVLQLSSTTLLGLRQFRSARSEIARCAQSGASVPLIACSASWLRARLQLATNRPQEAAGDARSAASRSPSNVGPRSQSILLAISGACNHGSVA